MITLTTPQATGLSAPSIGADSATASTAAAAGDSTQNRFLTLLVSQLRNQDPLNPLDNAQITSQLAQLSTVSGINQLNSTLTALSASFDAKQYLQAASLVGHDVVVDGNALSLAEGKGNGAFELAADADHVTVTVTDAAGRAVRKLDLGALTPGTATFEWDGRDDVGAAMKDGKYTLSVNATNNGKSVGATPLAVGRVGGIIPGANGGTLQIEGVGRADLTSVREIG